MRKKDTKNNLLRFGLILLLVLIGAMFLIGQLITRTGRKMNNNLADERSIVSLQNIRAEFNNTVSLLALSADVVANSSQRPEAAFAESARIIFRLDQKVSRIWFSTEKGGEVLYFDHGVPEMRRRPPNANEIAIKDSLSGRSEFNSLFFDDTTFVWSIASRAGSPGEKFILGAEVSSERLFEFMTEQDSRDYRSSYIYIYSSKGIVLFSPDNVSIGKKERDPVKLASIRQAALDGTTVRSSIQEEFLLMPAERFFYPLTMGTERWVVAITVLHITFEDTLTEFNRYVTGITLVAIVLFSALLIYSQSRMRREHQQRLKAEQQSAKLQMDRLIEHLQPHFLFNSLHSLYSQIKKEPERARQFVLKLAGLYRYLLEQRNDPLSTVYKEIEILEQYMFLQSSRFGEQIELSIDIDKSVEGMLIPSMSLQSLVENAIKHNAFSPEEPLHIRVYSTDEAIVVENVVSEKHTAGTNGGSTGLGFESLKSIYKYYSDREIRFGRVGNMFRCELPLLKINNSPLR